MDRADQQDILSVVEQRGRDNVVVLLGTPDSKSTEVWGKTVVSGDPTATGPLTNVPLGLALFHVAETAADPYAQQAAYWPQLGPKLQELDTGPILQALDESRRSSCTQSTMTQQ
ncbi:MAG: hypothetical protein JO352_25640 [Chloroflexi bacterium]|nr:hypothetical protein [Chloroflexota bacterium]